MTAWGLIVVLIGGISGAFVGAAFASQFGLDHNITAVCSIAGAILGAVGLGFMVGARS